MCELTDYLKSLNPKSEEQAILIYGSEYDLWREEKYIGSAIWVKDDNIGDSFQTKIVDEKGRLINQVYIADHWKMKIK